MIDPSSRRVTLAALLFAGSLGAAAAVIVWQTARPPAVGGGGVADPAPDLEPPLANDREPATTTPGVATRPSAAPDALAANASDTERALAAEVRSLVAAGQIGKARTRANAYYERFPKGPSEAELGRLTGAHPRRDATGTRP
jgi:hypothetical protein